MSGDQQYALRKLGQIVATLATEPGDARERVASAYQLLMALADDDFPTALRDDLEQIHREMQRRRRNSPLGKYAWTNRTAARIARRMYDLWFDLCKHPQASVAPRAPASRLPAASRRSARTGR